MTSALATRLSQACRWGGLLALAVGYALLSHLAAASSTPSLPGALVAVAPLLGLSLLLAWRAARRLLMLLLWLAGCALLYGLRDRLLAHSPWIFLLEHAGTHAMLCASFGLTLRHGETPMVTRFARLLQGQLSPAVTRYTRAATWAWTAYFGGIAGLSLLLFGLAPIALWSTFAYLLGLPLLALMFVAEYAARCCVLPPADRAGPLEAIRAYRQASAKGAVRPDAQP